MLSVHVLGRFSTSAYRDFGDSGMSGLHLVVAHVFLKDQNDTACLADIDHIQRFNHLTSHLTLAVNISL